MKRLFLLLSACMLGFLLPPPGAADLMAPPVFIYVDAAPNVYGSSLYPAWQTAAFEKAASGTFINMENGTNPAFKGTTNFVIEDEVVYSFGDLGKRLTWVYWIPNETLNTLAGRFTISLINLWDGEYLDFYKDYYGSTWLTPTRWQDYDKNGDGLIDGVIGTAGMAWWGAYGVNTPEALALDIAEWAKSEEYWIFRAQLDNTIYLLTSYRAPVPEPLTLLFLGTGLLGMAIIRKSCFNKHRFRSN